MNEQPETRTKIRAIVLIPGMKREERGIRRQVLTDNLVAVVQHRRLEPGPPVEIEGEVGQRIIAKPLRGGGGEATDGPDQIDVFEAYWADMIPDVAEMGPWARIGKGLELLVYWLFVPTLSFRAWGDFLKRPMLGVGLAVGALLLLLWYLSLVVAVGGVLTQAGVPEPLRGIPALQVFLGRLGDYTDLFRQWQYWAIVVAFLSFVRVDEIVGGARSIKDYLENKIPRGEEDTVRVGLKDRMRQRVIATLERVLAASYDDVVVVAHSFGTVIAVDILREWPHKADFERLKLVTLGSPLVVVQQRSAWLREELAGLLREGHVKRWSDYYSATDWLCDAVPGHANAFGNEQSHELAFEASLPQRLTGRTHLRYYQDPNVLTELARAR